MKTTILNLLFNIIVIQITICQDYFEILNTPDSLDIRTVFVDNNSDIFIGNAMNSGGGLFISQNNGTLWNVFSSLDTGIYSINKNGIGFIYAQGGGDLLRTTNNGQSWETIRYWAGSVIETSSTELMFASGSTSTYSNLLKSTDYGDTWNEVAIYSNVEFVKDIEIKNSDTIYVGTTKYTGNGGGVYCSVDGGDSWDHIGLTDHFVSSIALNSRGDLYAGTRGGALGSGGVFVLPNGYIDWIQLYDNDLVTSMVINEEDEIYIGCSNVIGPWGGVRRSVDDGQTWEDISHPSMMIYCMDELVLDHEGYLYALVEDSPAPLYRSINPTTKVAEEKAEPGIITYNYPNPFTESTTIRFSIPGNKPIDVHLKIFNTKGIIIEELMVSQYSERIYNIDFSTEQLPAGIYYYTITTGSLYAFNKMVLQK